MSFPLSSRYRSSRNLNIPGTECPKIRTSNIRMSAPRSIYFLRERRKKFTRRPSFHTCILTRLSHGMHMIVQDVAWASALTSRARWFATSSGRPHATIVSARWAPYGAFRLRALHLSKAAARSCEKDNAARPPTTAVSFTQIRIGIVPRSRPARQFTPGLCFPLN